jgi:membrane protein implicated in regulation of membrane protease activity
MEASTLWWTVAAALVIAEMLTGTVYLLTLAAGLISGALAAHAGMSMTVQVLVATAVSVGSTLAWHFSKTRQSRKENAPATFNADVNQDIGAQVQVDAWNLDGTAQINYRGAQWTVLAMQGAQQLTGAHRVKEVIGSRLVVEKI